MISDKVLNALISYTEKDSVKCGELLRNYTSFRIGGPADCLVEIDTVKQLTDVSQYLKREKIPFYVLGNGSNTLFSDRGYEGVVLHLGNKICHICTEGNRIYAEAGAMLSMVSHVAQKAGLTGLEFAAGIPGTVGGGVVMNAGAYDGEMKMVVTGVKAVTPDGDICELTRDELGFGYRSSILRHTGYVVTDVTFELSPGSPEEILSKMQDFNARRKEKQPIELPSAGSTFKRPEGYFAGKLIMDAGLKGFQIGGARVSDKHCGFIVNVDNATSEDVRALIREVQSRVRERFGVELEPEIEIL